MLTTDSQLAPAGRLNGPVPRDGKGFRRIAWLLAFLLLMCGQPETAWSQQYAFQRYGKAEGLGNLNVFCLLQDATGFLWACSENGVYRYDGKEFQRFGEERGLENTMVSSGLRDLQGRLWFATSSDVYLLQSDRFVAVRPAGQPIRSPTGAKLSLLPDGRLLLLANQRAQVLQAGTAPGQWSLSAYFSPEQLASTPALADLSAAYHDREGRLWLGCGRSICQVQGDEVRVWSQEAGVSPDRWLSFLHDSSGRLWARGTRRLLALAADGANFERQAMPDAELTAMVERAMLAEGADGSVVVRSNQGLARWHQGHWSVVTMANGLASSDVATVFFDRDGELWLSTTGQGLMRWIGFGHVENWTPAQGLTAEVVWGMLRLPDEGGVMVGTRSGCSLLVDGEYRARPCPVEGLAGGEVSTIARSADGRRWMWVRGGHLKVVEPGQRMARTVANLPMLATTLIDSRQRLWLPTRRGLYMIDTKDRRAVVRRVGDETQVMDVAEDASGAIWAAGSEGLQRFADGRWTHLALEDKRALPGFSTVAVDADGSLWATSRSLGLLHAVVDGDRLVRHEWVQHPAIVKAGLMFVRVANGRVWVGTDDGVVALQDGRWTRLTMADGLVWDDVDYNSFLADRDGSVWIGTSNGLTHFIDPGPLLRGKPMAVRIVESSFAGEPVEPGAGNAEWDWSPTAALDLKLASFNFARSHDAVFRYRIAGVDRTWFESRSPQVHYPALEPGRYEFEAQIVDKDRNEPSPAVLLAFTVRAPWWMTASFRAAVALLLLAALALAWRWQVARLNARHAVAQRESHERSLLLERATRDALTGLWNRGTIVELLNRAVEQARTTGGSLAVAMVDLDHFKQVNDSHGHAVGDAVLTAVSQRLGGVLREVDLLGRYGGEELLVVLPGLRSEVPSPAVERLREVLASAPVVCDGLSLRITCSIGVAWLSRDASTSVPGDADRPATGADLASQLFKKADAALYRAKQGGRNRVAYAQVDAEPVPAPVPADAARA